jgi:nucleotide-binding universal stress UspA family protein
MNDIIVGIDRSETAHSAAIAAAELAAAYRTNLHLVMCIDRTKPVNMTAGGDAFHSDSVAEAEQFLASVKLGLPHDSITHAVGFSSPAKMLCEEAERLDARTIVVGNRRVQGISRVLGSVASDVTRHAPCAVLIANTFND